VQNGKTTLKRGYIMDALKKCQEYQSEFSNVTASTR